MGIYARNFESHATRRRHFSSATREASPAHGEALNFECFHKATREPLLLFFHPLLFHFSLPITVHTARLYATRCAAAFSDARLDKLACARANRNYTSLLQNVYTRVFFLAELMHS